MGRLIETELEKEKQLSVALAQSYLIELMEQNAWLNPSMRRMLKEIQQYLLRGGKWHRPWLTRLGVTLLQKKISPAIFKASLTTEFLHRFLLVHDDIVDKDYIRHNGPTLQKIYQRFHQKHFAQIPDETDSLGNAMIGGDIINAFTYQLLLDSGLPGKVTLHAVRTINQDIIDTAAGWLLETHLKQRSIKEVIEKDVVQSMKLVSAHYSVLWPLRLGEILTGRSYGAWLPEIEIYGTQVGLAFQIQDDILAIFGDQNQTGKPVGNDLREGKKTLLTQYAYAHADATGRELLETCMNRDIKPIQLKRIRKLFTTTGALRYATTKAESHAKKGIKAIEQLNHVNDTARNTLIDLADYLVHRNV